MSSASAHPHGEAYNLQPGPRLGPHATSSAGPWPTRRTRGWCGVLGSLSVKPHLQGLSPCTFPPLACEILSHERIEAPSSYIQSPDMTRLWLEPSLLQKMPGDLNLKLRRGSPSVSVQFGVPPSALCPFCPLVLKMQGAKSIGKWA